MSITMKSTKHFGFDPTPDPLKGPRGDTAFLKENYKYMAVGSIFRTPKARFSHAQVHAGAKKAGVVVEIVEEGPWLRVKMIGKIGPVRPTAARPRIIIARSVEIVPEPASTPTSTPSAPTPDIDIFS